MHTNPRLKLGSKLLWPIVLILVAASWAGNIWYYQSMQLKKPVFLKHFIMVSGNQSDRIELSYLENKMKGRKVTGIRLEELPMLQFQINPHPNSYKYQVLGKAYGEWRTEDAAQMEKVPITINEATVYYSEGQPERVPIGEIKVVWDQSEGLFEMSSSGGSSDGTGRYSVTVKQPVTLEQVDYSFSNRLSSIFKFDTNGSDGLIEKLPIRLSAGDPLTFNYRWTIPENTLAVFEVYKAYILLTFKTEDGRTVYERIPTNFNLYLYEKEINRLVRSGGELF